MNQHLLVLSEVLICIITKIIVVINATKSIEAISGRVVRVSATDTADSGSIPGRVKPKTIKISIHSFRD